MSSLPVPLSPVSRTVEETSPDPLDRAEDLLHPRALADDVGEGVLGGELLLQVDVLVLELLLPERPVDQEAQLLDVERLEM